MCPMRVADYAGRAVIVTGGTRGIGAGIARAFLEAGAQVLVCGRTEPSDADPLPSADGRVAVFTRADVRDPAQAQRLIGEAAGRFGRLDVVVSNAGGSPAAAAAAASPRLHAKVIELNLIAPLHVAQAANAVMQGQPGGGSIIMIGSVSGTRPSPGTTRIEDRLQTITQQILSRTRLERIIQDFNLYPELRKTAIMEDVVERMRASIGVQVVKGDAFRVSFTTDDARTAMRVTERLASLFIEENLRDREVLAEGTNQFLEAQLEDARRRLVETEHKVEEYKKQYDGELPEQREANMQGLHNTEMQMQALIEAMNRDRDRRLVLERQIADLESDAN